MFEVPAGGRRYRALELLVKQKRMAKTQPVPCVIRDGGIAEDDSLAENDERVGLHPLDQFRAFKVLRDATKPEIKAAVELMFKVTVDSVQTVQHKGKTKRFGKSSGRRDHVKKAYVCLAAGQELNFSGEAA